jgi:putative ABC transport system permease protein
LWDLGSVGEECAQFLRTERRSETRRWWMNISWLDFKLGLRMLTKYPGLTIVGGLGMATAIAIAAGFNAYISVLQGTTLPLPVGDRLVSLQNWDVRFSYTDRRSLRDFVTWRAQLRSVEEVSAFRDVTRTLVSGDGSAEPISIAEMSASGFRAAGVRPIMGRHLVDEDERPGAPPVVVIGYDVWQQRFESDAQIVGRQVRFGSTFHTIVGVMPDGFAFPVNHSFWMPFRADLSAHARRAGPEIRVFGRLAQGKTIEDASAELAVIGQNASASFPQTHENLRARVYPYTLTVTRGSRDPNEDDGVALVMRLMVTLLLCVICVNVAALVYARTAMRRSEILVRTAIGASRARVVSQLFVEAFVLALLSAAVGLGVVTFALDFAANVQTSQGKLPFWFELRLTPGVILYGLALAVFAAVITGVLPAMKATGRNLQTGLQQLSARGSGLQLGRTWTLLIVAQVTLTVAALPAAVWQGEEWLRIGTTDAGYASKQYLSAVVLMERDWQDKHATDFGRDFRQLYSARISELVLRLRSRPEVAEVTYAARVPGVEYSARVEVEPRAVSRQPKDSRLSNVRSAQVGRVDPGFFDAFDVPVRAGRDFTAADATPASRAVIVNESFVKLFIDDGSPLGRRVREVLRTENDITVDSGPWYEIVGVVPDFPNAMTEATLVRLYLAAQPGAVYPALLAIRLRGEDPSDFAPELRRITAALDPALQMQNVRTLESIHEETQSMLRMAAYGVAGATASVLLLSAAGIYAMMSLAVARRRREIGIRSALGANPRRILASIFARATLQIGAGIAVGLICFLGVFKLTGGSVRELLPSLVLVAGIMITVGLLASMAPARRGLRIQPTEALRSE